jgi:mono/diheme cytochrome c family protein
MIRTRLGAVLLTTVALALVPRASVAQANQTGPTRSVRDGVYTEEQAGRGAKVNEEACASCHMQDWFTETLLLSWAGATADMLYDLIRTTMPQDRPDGLSRQQYADILAYIFQLNGLPPGEDELPAGNQELQEILIEQKQQ